MQHLCLSSYMCKQKTYGTAKSFRCNTYKKHGGGGPSFPFWNSCLGAGQRHPRSFFSCTYALPILQLLSFHTHACNGGCTPFWLCASLPRSLRPYPPSPISFIFTPLRTLLRFFALIKNSTLLFSISSALFAKNTRGWGTYPSHPPPAARSFTTVNSRRSHDFPPVTGHQSPPCPRSVSYPPLSAGGSPIPPASADLTNKTLKIVSIVA